MQSYQDMGDNYEPSADELIDVLKNLENLAAVNPALYRAIVDQIKGKHTYSKPYRESLSYLLSTHCYALCFLNYFYICLGMNFNEIKTQRFTHSPVLP